MKTVFVLILFWGNGHQGASSQMYYESMAACQETRTRVISEWKEGRISDGMAGYLSGLCVEAKHP